MRREHVSRRRCWGCCSPLASSARPLPRCALMLRSMLAATWCGGASGCLLAPPAASAAPACPAQLLCVRNAHTRTPWHAGRRPRAARGDRAGSAGQGGRAGSAGQGADVWGCPPSGQVLSCTTTRSTGCAAPPRLLPPRWVHGTRWDTGSARAGRGGGPGGLCQLLGPWHCDPELQWAWQPPPPPPPPLLLPPLLQHSHCRCRRCRCRRRPHRTWPADMYRVLAALFTI